MQCFEAKKPDRKRQQHGRRMKCVSRKRRRKKHEKPEVEEGKPETEATVSGARGTMRPGKINLFLLMIVCLHLPRISIAIKNEFRKFEILHYLANIFCSSFYFPYFWHHFFFLPTAVINHSCYGLWCQRQALWAKKERRTKGCQIISKLLVPIQQFPQKMPIFQWSLILEGSFFLKMMPFLFKANFKFVWNFAAPTTIFRMLQNLVAIRVITVQLLDSLRKKREKGPLRERESPSCLFMSISGSPPKVLLRRTSTFRILLGAVRLRLQDQGRTKFCKT